MLEDLVFAALRTACLSGLVMLCLRVMRIRHSQLLLSAWTGVLLASLAMPILQHHVLVIANLPLAPAASIIDFAPLDAVPELSGLGPPAVLSSGSNVADWRQLASLSYLIVAGVMFVRLAMGLLLSLRLLHTSRPISEPWTSGQPVRESNIIRTPVTVGSSILLPADHSTWSADTLRAVIVHETSHVTTRDYYLLALSQLNRAIFWFSPLAWWLHWRLISLAELAGDDAAMAELADRPGYARILLEMAGRPCSVKGAVPMARPSTIRQRIERALALHEIPCPASRFKRLASLLGVAPLTVIAAISIAGAESPNRAAVDEQREPHKAITIDEKLLDAYAGFYKNQKTGSLMVVTREGDHLLTRRAPNRAVAEYPYTDHDFFLTIAPQQNSFITNATDKPIRVIHHQLGRTETLERISQEDGQRDLASINQRLSDQRTPRIEVHVDPSLLDRYVGAYQLAPQRIFTVTRDGDKLFARLTGQNVFQVHPYTDRDFFYTIVAAQLSFVLGSEGNATALILHQNGQDRTAERVDPKLASALDTKLEQERKPRTAIAIDPQVIGRYVGRYLNDTMEITATREGNQLFVQVTGFGRYPVYPYTDHDFFATILPTQLTFVTDSTGKATQMIRHRGGTDAILNRVD